MSDEDSSDPDRSSDEENQNPSKRLKLLERRNKELEKENKELRFSLVRISKTSDLYKKGMSAAVATAKQPRAPKNSTNLKEAKKGM
jgi:molecular chaperone GrpE (heat shock protein)